MKNKFRAWVNGEPHILPNGDFTLSIHDDRNIMQVWCSDGLLDEIEIDSLDRFTGFKDKNGKEIYEGDPMRAYHCEFEIFEKGKVEFSEGRFSIGRYWKDGIHDWYSMEQYTQSELEIIG